MDNPDRTYQETGRIFGPIPAAPMGALCLAPGDLSLSAVAGATLAS